jgi:hypothetical protein
LRLAGTSCCRTHEAIVRASLLRREKAESLEARLDCAQGTAVSCRDVRERLSGLECRDERAFFVVSPRAAHVTWKLRASLCASRRLFQGRDAGKQRAQDISLLQNRTGRELVAGEGIDTLDEGLKNMSGALFLHEVPSLVLGTRTFSAARTCTRQSERLRVCADLRKRDACVAPAATPLGYSSSI